MDKIIEKKIKPDILFDSKKKYITINKYKITEIGFEPITSGL